MFRISAALARLGLLERVKLSPEGIPLADAKRLVRALISRGQRVFHLSYHSPSLVPGNTPYVRTAADVTNLLSWLDDFFWFFREEIKGRCVAMSELYGILKKCRNTGSAGDVPDL